uniref:Tetratricopeptide repeat protein 7 N-terminal domain-containing protein n=1 Tax=Panagrolaimus sp. PS1159 TaxID=55785 RepID=A0AC35GQM8_9BILA
MATTKLKGSKLEAEVDKCRGECNWEKLNHLITNIRTRNSGVEKLIHLVDGELSLEVFLQKHAGSQVRIEPRAQHKDFLRRAEGQLRNAITNNSGEAAIVMEAYLLLAKLYYFCASFNEALSSIEKSQMDKATTQFTTLRSLKLAAEGYAVKGLAIEHTLPRDRKENDMLYKRVVSSFEKSAELALSYISELEKSVNSSTNSATTAPSNIRIGGLLEIALERVSYLSLRRNTNDRRWDLEGLEWYRKIAIGLSDKVVVMKLHQRLCRQLAEVLLRGMIDVGCNSAAISSKSESLNFYTGSKNFFSPASRSEETILLLLISELLASKNIRASNTFDDEILDRVQLIRNLKKVHNLLSIVLSNLRQYNLLASVYERAMKFANKDRFMWFQFGLSLMSSGQYARSSKILEHCVKLEASDHNNVAEHLMIAKVNLESLGDFDLAMEHASNALSLCSNTWQSSRCTLVYALAFSQKLQTVSSFETRKVLMTEAIKHFEKAIHLDPHDELAHLYTALQYAICRDLEKAIEHCQRSLEINDEQPSAIMLMALLFTARRDFKSALTLVLNALIDYPNHYGLLVLRLKLEAKYGRLDEVLHTSKNLFSFWRKLPITYNHIITEEDNDVQNGHMEKAESTIALKPGSVVHLSSKDALAPVTPMFTAPLGIAAASHVSLTNSNLDIAENGSVLASTAANLSEYGGAASTVSGSLGILSSGSTVCSIASAFRIQANIWVELAEFFIELDRATEVQACVEEACNIFPNSHEALYLKSRLFLIRGNKAP